MQEDFASGLSTLQSSGAQPTTRVSSPLQAKSIVTGLKTNDQTRSRKRSLVKGLVDGYPPFKASDLRKAGRATATNVNWRVAEAYLGSALGAFYDLFHEAETYATVQLDPRLDPKAPEWSKIVTEEFDLLQKADATFDYVMQISQYETVLFGSGPVFFGDEFDWTCREAQCKDVLIPERAKSDTSRWELCVVLEEFSPDKLYARIANEKAATGAGWNVKATRNAIVHATEDDRKAGQNYNWEWHEQQLKNDSFAYSMRSKTINVAHLLYREFPSNGRRMGKISHRIILDDDGEGDKMEFLFTKLGRFDNWHQVVHPMYYDHGGGGQHHSVIGMGVKMYSAMEIQNRLLCKLTDDAFAPRVLLRPQTATDVQKISIARFGHYGVIPHNINVEQASMQPYITESLGLHRELSQTLSANLSLYRQFLQDKSGNPITATEASYKAGEQSRLSATQLNRYYVQLDNLYAERYRRVVAGNYSPSWPGGAEAAAFVAACVQRGVPREALGRVRAVRATRVVGQGSAFVRMQALEFLLNIIAMLPEEGRATLLRDLIASRVGQHGADRYLPIPEEGVMPSDQHAEAMDKVASMKVGVTPIITSSQNPAIYADTFITAAEQALTTVGNGGNPAEVLQFVDMAGTASSAHISRMAQDRSRTEKVKDLTERLKLVGKAADELRQQVQAGAQERVRQQAQQPDEGPSEQQTKAAQAQLDMEIKRAKAAQDMQIASDKAKQDLMLKDAQAAQKMREGNRKNAIDRAKAEK